MFPILYPNATGIDISSWEKFVSVNSDAHFSSSIRSFGRFTKDLKQLCDWLKECKVDTVGMAVTAIYWVSLFLLLEESRLEQSFTIFMCIMIKECDLVIKKLLKNKVKFELITIEKYIKGFK